MQHPYENIIIGNFLYGLGLAMGKNPNGVYGCVNLLQQTPLDRGLGDVMIQFPAVWRLIEFKRVDASKLKELTKLDMFIGATRKRPDLRVASRLVHWYAVSGIQKAKDVGDPNQSSVSVRPYLDMQADGGVSLESFAEGIVAEACSGRLTSPDDLDLYMEIIATFGGVKSFNTSALLVGVSGSGGLTYVPIPNLADLRGTAGMLRERMIAETLGRERQHLSFSQEVSSKVQALDRSRSSQFRERAIGQER